MAGAFVAGAIVSSLILDTKKWSSSVSKVNADQAKMAGMSEKTAGKFRKVGAAMTIVGGAIVAGMGKAVGMFGDFDQAMTESTSIMGDMSEEMRSQMEQTALQMSEDSVFAAKDLAESYFFLASAGLDAEESIAALPIVTNFATAGNFDLASATDLLTDAQSALGLTVDDTAQSQENMIRVSDVLVKANTLANASVSQFSEALTNKAGAAMRAYGIELESGVAVLAAFADQGTKGRDAGTQFSIVLRELQKAALQNKEAFKKAGVAVFDANGNFNNMGDIVAQLEERLGGMSAEQKKAEMSMLGFSEKSQMALLTLIGTSDKIKEYETNLRSAGGITDEVSKKQLLGFNNQMTMAKNKISAAAISIGEQLAPTIVSLATTFSDVVSKVRDFSQANPVLFGTITKLVAGLGAMMAILGPMVMMLPRLVSGLKLAGAAVKMLGLKMNVALGPIGLVTAGLLAAGAALNSWINAKKKAIDADIAHMVQTNKLGSALKARRTLIEGNVITQKEWTELVNKHGKDYNRVMTAIDRNPAYKNLKKALEDNKKAQEEAGEATDDHSGAASGLNTNLGVMKTQIEALEGPFDTYTMQQFQLANAYSDGEIGMGQYVARMAKLREEREKNLALFDEEEFAIDDNIEGIEGIVESWESVPPATQSVFQQIGLQSFDSKTEIEKHADGMKTEVTSIWSDMADGLKTKWSTAVSDLITTGDLFRGDFTGLVDTMKTQFFDMVGQMAAKIATGLFKPIIDGAANAAGSLLSSLGSALGGGGADSVVGGFESITGALTQSVNPIGMISGAVTAIASVASLFKKAGPSSTDSWHFEHTYIAVKELRDYTFLNIGSSSGWLAKIYDRNTDTFVILQTIRKLLREKHLKELDKIKKATEAIKTNTDPVPGLLKDINRSIKAIPKAQGGHTSTRTELVTMHGTPAKPEHAIPDDRLRDLLSMADAGGGRGRGDVNLQSDQQVNFNGLMISDRDYMRQRGIPELLGALKANVGLAELKDIIGVT